MTSQVLILRCDGLKAGLYVLEYDGRWRAPSVFERSFPSRESLLDAVLARLPDGWTLEDPHA